MKRPAWAFAAFLILLACAHPLPPPPAPPPVAARPAAPGEAPGTRAEAAPPVAAQPTVHPQSPQPPPRPLPAAPRVVRVGLATDLEAVSLPCCESELVAEAGGQRVAVVSAMRIEPWAAVARPPTYRLQVAALKDERQARGLAARLAERTGETADVVFDAGTDLYRVRIGRYPTREAADAARRSLAQINVHDAWVVGEPAALADVALRVTQAGRAVRVPGRWIEVRRADGEGIRVEGGRYRGKILVYLNDRGTLNLINEVEFEEYLRGVVPREMGPAIYDNLDALKAQTVAARTYTLKNMGEFRDEGYDICATPRCQVYGGMESEHPLTDRAIAETAGLVLLWQRELVDALYSSTCGGHTEDVGTVFPLKSAPYLKGVPCLESGIDQLAGASPRGETIARELARRLLPAAAGPPSASDFGGRLSRLARLAGLAVPDDRLASLERREVQRFIASQFDLALDARLFVAREDLAYLLDNPPAGWGEEELKLAAYLIRSGLLAAPLDLPLGEEELEETIFQLALFLRILERRDVRYLALAGGRLRFRAGAEVEELPLPGRLATFRRRGGEAEAGPLGLVPGDRLHLYLLDGELVGVSQEVDLDGVAYDRTSNLSSWTRFRTDSQLAELVRTRYPGLELSDLAVVARGVSGRVGKMRLIGADGRFEEVAGLPVRWTLDLPDTLFTVKRLRPSGREAGWLFSGRGWGHGVGMCQVGAYGMSMRGHGYDSILHHYYSGVELARLSQAAADPAPASAR